VVQSLRDDKKKPMSFIADTTTANAQVRGGRERGREGGREGGREEIRGEKDGKWEGGLT
jgi:hypothetical protein